MQYMKNFINVCTFLASLVQTSFYCKVFNKLKNVCVKKNHFAQIDIKYALINRSIFDNCIGHGYNKPNELIRPEQTPSSQGVYLCNQ